MAFDLAGALAAGGTEEGIADYLSTKYGYDIEGARKAGLDNQGIILHLLGRTEAPEKTGFAANLRQGATKFGQDIKRSVGLATDTDEQLKEQYALDAAENEASGVKTRGLADIEEGFKKGPVSGVMTIPGVIADNLGASTPTMAAMAAGARLGAAAAPPVLPVVGPLSKPIGAVVGGLTGAASQYFGSNAGRQIEENPDAPIDRGAAVAAGVGQGALDVLGAKLGLGTLAKRIAGLPAETAKDALINTAQQSIKASVGKGIVRGAAAEMPTEIAQQVLERAQAGLDLFDDEAAREYYEAGAIAGLVGGTLGGAAGPINRSSAQGQLEAEKATDRRDMANAARARAGFTQEALTGIETREDANLQEEAKQVDYEGLAAVPTQAQVVEEADAIKFGESLPTSATVAPQAARRDLMNGLLATPEGTQDVIDNVKNYFPELSSAERKQVKAELLQRRNLFKTGETPEPIIEEVAPEGLTQEEVESAFNKKKYPKIITDETLDELGLTKKMKAEVQDIIGKKASLALVAKRLGALADNPKWTKEGVATNIEVFLDSVAEPKAPAKSKLKEVLNVQPTGEATNTYRGPDAGAVEPSVEELDGGANATSPSIGQTDDPTVEPDSGLANPDLGGTSPERAALAAEPVEETWAAFSDVPFEKLTKAQKQQVIEAKADNYLNQPEADRIASLSRKTKAAPAPDPDEHLYSKGKRKTRKPAPVQRSTVDDVWTSIKTAFANPNFANKRIKVVQSASELEGVDPADYATTQGFYDGQTATLIADNIPKGKEMAVFLHEVGVHMGLERVIGRDRVNQLAGAVRTMAEGGKPSEKKIAEKAIARAEEANANSKEKVKNEELIAYFVEEAVSAGITPYTQINNQNRNIIAWLRNLWAGIASTVRKLGIDPTTISPEDVVALAYGAARIQGWETETSSEKNARILAENPNMTDAERLSYDPDYRAKIKPKTAEQDAFYDDEKDYEGDGADVEYYRSLAPAGTNFINTDELPSEETLNQPKTTTSERLKSGVTGAGFDKIVNKLLGPATTLYNQTMRLYGADQRINAETGKELGVFAFFRSQQFRNLINNAIPRGYMYFDEEMVPHIGDSDNNGVKLVQLESDFLESYVQRYPEKYSKETEARMALNYALQADRYKELQNQGKLQYSEFNDSQYNFGKEVQRLYPEAFKEIKDTWVDMRTKALDFLVESGGMARKMANEFIQRAEYVPFYRVQQETNENDATYYQGLLTGRAERKIGGSDKQIENTVDNMLSNLEWLYARGIKANAANLMAEQLVAMNNSDPTMGGYWTQKPAKAEDGIIGVFVDGKLKNLKVMDPNVATAFAAFPIMGSMTYNITRKATNYLRRGITLLPQFFIRQVWQDTFRIYMQTGSQAGMVSTFGRLGKGLYDNTVGETETGKKLASSGIVGQVDTLDNDNTWYEKAKATPKGVIHKTILAAERVARSSDLSARQVIYEEAKKRGASDNAASMEALLYLNYQNKGTSPTLNFLTALVPFINTQIQGEWRTFEAIRGNIQGISKAQAKKQLMSRIGMYGAMTALYAIAMAGDEDYEEQTDEVRNANYLINMGGVPLKIPVPSEYLFLKLGVEKLARNGFTEMTDDDQQLKQAFKQALFAVVITPDEVTPSGIKPILEGATNYSFYGDRPLVGPNLLQKIEKEQYTTATSELAKQVSAVLYDSGVYKLSPIIIDNFLRGLLGGTAQIATETSNYVLADRPELRLNEIPGVGSIFYNEEAGGKKARFYDLRDRVTKHYNTWRDLQESDPKAAAEFRAEHKDLINMNSRLSALTRQIDSLRDQYRRVLDSDLSREEKALRRSEIIKRERRVLANIEEMRQKVL